MMERTIQDLLDWYDKGHRELPWRSDPTPYHVWVSEIMLQQTRVEAVKPFYARFMNALPTVDALANAAEEDLLKLWEGLGYYSRVRNLQKAAQQIMSEYEGQIPGTYRQLLTLPGIGSYTAGAIASIGFGEPVAAVDGNVLRILSRLRGDSRCISDESCKKAVREEIEPFVNPLRPGDTNQAMMELGACVCVPGGAPLCEICPWEEYCVAHQQGRELEFPVKKKLKERTIEDRTILVVRDGNRIALRKRPDKGLLAGLYEYPSLEGHMSENEVLRYFNGHGQKVIRITDLPEAKHIFSHKEWHMRGYLVAVDELDETKKSPEFSDWIYIEPEETRDKYPIPSAFSVYTRIMQMDQGKIK